MKIRSERGISKTLLLAVFITASANGASCQHDLDKAERYYEAGDYQKAAKHWEKAVAGDDKTLFTDIKALAKRPPSKISDRFLERTIRPLLIRSRVYAFDNLAACLFSTHDFDYQLFALYNLLDYYSKAV
ncbi:MAG: hypothetical protein LBM19_04560 [Holosporales bacterium]|jgi:tetratricopeptide (TPR) repeat protein|nr:hypothetical protein [Holosporales bacterium]